MELFITNYTRSCKFQQTNLFPIFFECLNDLFIGFINENGGTVSDYINTAIQGHYETDFPELTSKFENIALGTNDNQDLF